MRFLLKNGEWVPAAPWAMLEAPTRPPIATRRANMNFIAKTKNLKYLRLADKGRAALLEFQQPDGSTAMLEVERDTLPNLLEALMAFAKVDGEKHPHPLPLPSTAPSEALLLPCEEIAVQTAPEGLWVKLRIGSLDLAVALPGKDAAKALGESLLHASKS